MPMNYGPRPMYVGRLQRSQILCYAASLIHPGGRHPGDVIDAAGPLLKWASAASGDTDQKARMQAMDHVHANAPQYRQDCKTGSETPARPTPGEFLADARAYYEFLTQD